MLPEETVGLVHVTIRVSGDTSVAVTESGGIGTDEESERKKSKIAQLKYFILIFTWRKCNGCHGS